MIWYSPSYFEGDLMGKYFLVSSYYDGSSFSHEKMISEISGNVLDDLRKIDFFTASHPSSFIFQLLEEELKLTNLNQLSVCYYRSQNSTPDYYHAIIHYPEYAEMIQSMPLKKASYYRSDGRRIDAFLIPYMNPLFKKKFDEIDGILERRDTQLFQQLYPYHNEFSFLVNRFCGSSFDSSEEVYLEREKIRREFSNYKTFRGWIVLEERRKKKGSSFAKKQVRNNDGGSCVVRNHYQNDEEEFLAQFREQHGISYEVFLKNQHNFCGLDEGKEEYLDVDEVIRMNGLDEEEQVSERKRRR